MEKIIKSRYVGLDCIRIVATLLIMLFHFDAHKVIKSPTYTQPFLKFDGSIGILFVTVFFMLSGCALMNSNRNELDIKKFYCKRFKAIFPTFWITYLIWFFLRGILYFIGVMQYTPNQANPLKIVLTFIGLDGYFLYLGPNFYEMGEWFLGAIIIFYIIFPILHLLIRRTPKLTFFILFFLELGVIIYNPFEVALDRNIVICLNSCYFGMIIGKHLEIIKEKSLLVIPSIISLFFIEILNLNQYQIIKYQLMASLIFIIIFIMGEISIPKKFFYIIHKIAGNTFIMYLIHHIFLIRVLFPIISKNNLSNLSIYLIMCIYVIIVYFIASLIKKIAHYILIAIKKIAKLLPEYI